MKPKKSFYNLGETGERNIFLKKTEGGGDLWSNSASLKRRYAEEIIRRRGSMKVPTKEETKAHSEARDHVGEEPPISQSMIELWVLTD